MLLNNARLTEIKLSYLSTGYFIFMVRKRTEESNLTNITPSTRSMLQTLLTAHLDNTFLQQQQQQQILSCLLRVIWG